VLNKDILLAICRIPLAGLIQCSSSAKTIEAPIYETEIDENWEVKESNIEIAQMQVESSMECIERRPRENASLSHKKRVREEFSVGAHTTSSGEEMLFYPETT
jgi:ribonuclease BN (tRNA processing enzyme)